MMIENARLSFPNLFRATAFNPDQAPKFSATFIIPKDSPFVEKIRQEIERAAKERWGQKATETLKSLKAQNKIALRDGAEKADYDGFGEDVVFINASTDKRPGVYDRDRTPLTQDDGKPYAGCYVNAIVEFWAQDNAYGKRINASLSGVQFRADGTPFGGGAAPATADDFPELEEETAAEDWL
jgi:hypothetical protein